MPDNKKGKKSQADIEFEKASALMKEKNYAEALKMYNSAAEKFLNMGGKSLENAAFCYYHMAGMHMGSNTDVALTCIAKSAEVCNHCPDMNKAYEATILDRYGEILADAKKYKEAQGEYLKSIKIREQLDKEYPGRYDYLMAETYVKINVILANIGEYKYSAAGFGIALGLYNKVFEKGENIALAGIANCYHNLTVIYKLTGMYSDAKKTAALSLEKWEWLALNENIEYKNRLTGVFNELVEVHKKSLSPLSEIEASYLKLAEIYKNLAKKAPEAVREDLATCYRSLANLHPGIFQRKKAKEYMQKAEDVYRRFGK